jgi:hypothetical protein
VTVSLALSSIAESWALGVGPPTPYGGQAFGG